jgi:uncharacterized membrane protein YfcA
VISTGVPELVLLVGAGFTAGLTGSIAGLASVISYPALLAVGLSPISANVTNTVALIFNGIGSALGSGPELVGQRARLLRLGLAGVIGGLLGSFLLLATPSSAFEKIVPWLIGVACLAIAAPRRKSVMPEHAGHHIDPKLLPVGIFAISIYGGYFGAAAGVLMLALLLAATPHSLARSNAARNVILGMANGVAAVIFAAFGPVNWEAAAPLALGFLAGGRLGPSVVRRVPARPLRLLIGLAGLGLALYLGINAYS